MIACLFMVGSACFVLGSVPAYLNAVGGPVDGVTYFVGSIFFTSASLFQLVQSQTPASTEVTAQTQGRRVRLRWFAWLPHDRSWLAAATQFPGTLCFNVSTFAALVHNATTSQVDRYVWRPDVFGSILFLVSSAFAVAAIGGTGQLQRHSQVWRIAWLNMVGSILFMLSAIGSFVLPTDQAVSVRASIVGTLLGAVCFFLGAALMFPAWREAMHDAPAPQNPPPHQ